MPVREVPNFLVRNYYTRAEFETALNMYAKEGYLLHDWKWSNQYTAVFVKWAYPKESS